MFNSSQSIKTVFTVVGGIAVIGSALAAPIDDAQFQARRTVTLESGAPMTEIIVRGTREAATSQSDAQAQARDLLIAHGSANRPSVRLLIDTDVARLGDAQTAARRLLETGRN